MDPDEICPACEAVNCWCCNAELRDACRRLRQERDEARAEVERLRPMAEAAQALSQACADEGAWLADKASDEGWIETERAIKALWDIAPAK